MGKIRPTIMSIRKNLTDDLLSTKYRRNLSHNVLSNTTGHCYVASEALYHLLTEVQRRKFKPYYLKIDDMFHQTITHWYLMTDDKLEILDPTYDQFSYLPNYGSGTRAAFLTKTPSKRAKILIGRISKRN